MDRDVGIVGIGETPPVVETDDSLEEVVHEAARATLADADVDRQDVDNVVVCATDLEDGRAISSMVAACPAGGYRKDFIKTTDTPVHALALAAMRMEAGVFDSTLVLSWSKQSETDEGPIRRIEADPMYRRNTGLGHVTGHALTAATYAAEADDAAAAADAVVERNTANAAANDRGLPADATSSDEAGASELVSSPIREAHLPDPTDGACGVLLAADDLARSGHDDPVWLQGLGWETDHYDLSTQTAGEMAALTGAAESAYTEAGVDDPLAALDAAEIHEQSAFHELLALESLGLADEGAAPVAVLDGAFDGSGDVAVNPSGGPFAANPHIATGMARVTAAARQVRAGDADRVAATATAGFTDQCHGVAVLGGDAA